MNLILGLLILIIPWSAFANPPIPVVSFSKIWTSVSENSPELKAKAFSQEAAEVSSERLSLHWLPRLRAETKAFNSDDPTINFFGLLGEKQVAAQDFNPSQLNSPGAHSFVQTTVGADLPLYEGGQSQAALKAQEKTFEAKKIESMSAQLHQYSEVARLYGEIISFTRQSNSLLNLLDRADLAIGRYRLGTRANPVGYSGLLALKALRNKISAQLDNISLQLKNNKRALELLSGQLLPDGQWNVGTSVSEFLKTYAPAPNATVSLSQDVRARLVMAEAATHKVSAEQAKYLPQVGLFAQDNLYTGERGSSSAYVAGAYLRWNLGATDIGAAKEARLEASAAQAQARAIQINDQIQSAAAGSSLETLKRTMSLMEENETLLTEQWTVSETLFKNGSLTAHQLSEVLSRTVDVVQAKSQIEQNYIIAHLELLVRSEFNVSPEKIRSLK